MTDKLEKNKIISYLQNGVTLDELRLFDSLPSTNDALYQYIKTHPNQCAAFLSEEQTAGKGRQGKKWHSPAFQNIYLSLAWHLNKPASTLQLLSVDIGKALVKMLTSYPIQGEVTLKYPNDILVNNQKIAGILTETFAPTKTTTSVIIGIGFNIHLTQGDNQINQPWTSLDIITSQINDRNKFASNIISTLFHLLRKIK